MRTNEELIKDGNHLARLLYASMGCEVPAGYRFDKAHHPQEVGCWNAACIAYDFIEGTDLQSAADEEEE